MTFSICALLLSQLAPAQKEISGVTPAESIIISGEKLDFNGAGLKEKYFFDYYVGALYVSTKGTTAKEIIEANESMAITLDIVSSLVTSEKMISVIKQGFEKSKAGNRKVYKLKIQELQKVFKEEIVKGDHFVIAYVKNIGIEVYKNGKQLNSIQGLGFKKAVFGIWLSEDPTDEELKRGLLGDIN